MNAITITAGPMTYVVSRLKIPSPDELPWGGEECDAFVAVLAAELLTDELAGKISSSLVRLRTGWVETMGERSEYVHDLVDNASVEAGRQARVGDGNPMTAWHDDMHDVNAMIEYVRIGGQGATGNKLVVVIAGEDEATVLAKEMEKACQRPGQE
jgi:hypothetical protein